MSDRIRLIDALRGLALAGIAMVHFGEQYLGYLPPASRQWYAIHGPVDGIIEALSWILIRGKGFGLFSFMFGLSFALQMQRAVRSRPGVDFRPRFLWRLVVLFAIGAVHTLVYNGDILTVYAVLGLPLVLFYRASDRLLLALAIVLLIGTPRIMQRVLVGPVPVAEQRAMQQRLDADAEAHWQALTRGDLGAIARHHATTGFRGKWEFQFGLMGRGYQTFGLFLLGLLAGRHRVFERVETHRTLFVRTWRWTGLFTLILPLAAGALFAAASLAGSGGAQPEGSQPDLSSWPLIAGLSAFDAWNNAMTLFYVSSFALLSLRPSWARRLLWLAPPGQTALSVYVGQTLIGAFVYFGVGLGLLGAYGNSVNVPLGLAVFLGQAAVARWWLARFRFGPLEWLWRSATWFRWEPLRAAPRPVDA